MELTLDSPSLTLNLISWTPSGRRPPQAGPCTVLKGILPTKRHPPHPLETQPQTAPDASTPDICECPPHAHMCQALSTARRARPGSYRAVFPWPGGTRFPGPGPWPVQTQAASDLGSSSLGPRREDSTGTGLILPRGVRTGMSREPSPEDDSMPATQDSSFTWPRAPARPVWTCLHLS